MRFANLEKEELTESIPKPPREGDIRNVTDDSHDMFCNGEWITWKHRSRMEEKEIIQAIQKAKSFDTLMDRGEIQIQLENEKLKAENEELKKKADLWDEHDIKYCTEKSDYTRLKQLEKAVRDRIEYYNELLDHNQKTINNFSKERPVPTQLLDIANEFRLIIKELELLNKGEKA